MGSPTEYHLHPSGDELSSKFQSFRAISSGVERLLHTQEVAGSNPASRTILLLRPHGKAILADDFRRLKATLISYALAIDHNENRIALESGNTPDVIHTNYRALVTREEAERFWNIRPLVNTPTNGTKNFGMSKPTKSKKTETTSPIKKVESAKSTPAEDFAK